MTEPTTQRFLAAADILGTDDIPYKDVYVDEWGGVVRVRGLTAAQRAKLNASSVMAKGQDVVVQTEAIARAQLNVVAMCLYNEQNERLFTDAQVAQLAEKSAGVVERLFIVAQRLSGLGVESAKEAEGN